ncbi:MAG: type II secretion system GspH family protein [Bacteroidales bacterium]|jgi:competence protein ComGF|nr:type II secretion system GspH family protein [Bacteroidales bacterium]
MNRGTGILYRLRTKRLRAFTLSELVITMVLIVIVVSSAMAAYKYLFRYTINHKQSEIQDYTMFQSILNSDVEKSELVIALASDRFVTRNYNMTETEYIVDMNFWVRKTQARQDTFFFSTESFVFETFYNSDIVHTIDLVACYDDVVIKWVKRYPEHFYWTKRR